MLKEILGKIYGLKSIDTIQDKLGFIQLSIAHIK